MTNKERNKTYQRVVNVICNHIPLNEDQHCVQIQLVQIQLVPLKVPNSILSFRFFPESLFDSYQKSSRRARSCESGSAIECRLRACHTITENSLQIVQWTHGHPASAGFPLPVAFEQNLNLTKYEVQPVLLPRMQLIEVGICFSGVVGWFATLKILAAIEMRAAADVRIRHDGLQREGNYTNPINVTIDEFHIRRMVECCGPLKQKLCRPPGPVKISPIYAPEICSRFCPEHLPTTQPWWHFSYYVLEVLQVPLHNCCTIVVNSVDDYIFKQAYQRN